MCGGKGGGAELFNLGKRAASHFLKEACGVWGQVVGQGSSIMRSGWRVIFFSEARGDGGQVEEQGPSISGAGGVYHLCTETRGVWGQVVGQNPPISGSRRRFLFFK